MTETIREHFPFRQIFLKRIQIGRKLILIQLSGGNRKPSFWFPHIFHRSSRLLSPLCPSGRCWRAGRWTGRPPPGWSRGWGFVSPWPPEVRSVPPTSKTLPFPSEAFGTKKNREEKREKWDNFSSFHHKDNSPAGKHMRPGNGEIIYSDRKHRSRPAARLHPSAD